jgi:predicted permease
MHTLLKDLRYAFRLLRRSPGFTTVALLSLGLGIGANTAIFSLVNAVVLRPMPVEDAESLISVFMTDERNQGNLPFSHLNFKDVRDQNTSFAAMAAVSFGQVNYLPEGGTSSQQPVQLVSGNYFDLLGVRMAAGRGFRAEEDEAPGAFPVAVLSWPFWQKEFGGAPDVVGRTMTLNRTPFTVVGVAPRAFTGTFTFGPTIWLPMAMHEVAQPEIQWYEERRGLFLAPFGRLRTGVSADQARENLRAIMGNLEREHAADNAGRSATVVPMTQARIDPNGQGQLVNLSRLLLATVGVVLLIACANLANLLLARASKRRRELAVRLAIGANRGVIVRQLLTESVTLAVLGGALGLVLANWLVRVLVAAPNLLPVPIDDTGIALDPRVMLFTLAVSVGTGLLFGLAPALEAARSDVVGSIKRESLPGGDGRRWLRKTLVGAQVALSVVSLVAAGLFLRSLAHTARIEPGFATDTVATFTVNLGREGFDEARGRIFYQQLVERAEALPGVRSASVAQNVPLGGGTFLRSVFLDTSDATEQDRRLVNANYVSPGFFRTTDIPLLQGRDFDSRDTADAPPVAIVNEAMARQFWPDRPALGQRFRFFGEDTPTEVVGIARNSKVNGLVEDPPVAMAYEPILQDYQSFASLLVRTDGPAAPLAPGLRAAVKDIDPALSVLNVRTLADQVRQSMTGQQTLTGIVGILGGVALLLAAMGLYGVASYWVGQRTREIGVRMALGAKPAGMLTLVLRQSMTVVGVGLVVGLLLSLALGRAVGSQASAVLVDVSPTDAVTLVGTTVVLCLVALAACIVPARRAARIDPVIALRQD